MGLPSSARATAFLDEPSLRREFVVKVTWRPAKADVSEHPADGYRVKMWMIQQGASPEMVHTWNHVPATLQPQLLVIIPAELRQPDVELW